MDYVEMDHHWLQGYNAGYRRAIEWIKEQSGHGDVELDRFLEELVKDMTNEWYN